MVNQPKLVNKIQETATTGTPDLEEEQALAVLRLPGKDYLATITKAKLHYTLFSVVTRAVPICHDAL